MSRQQAVAAVLDLPPDRVRVVSQEVGGNFGTRNAFYPEFALVAWAARRIGRPVKWTCERQEAFLSDYQGRDLWVEAELALDADAKFTGLKVSTIANMGAYLSTFATCIPTYLYGTLLAGTYTTPAISVETRAVFTHTVPESIWDATLIPFSMYETTRSLWRALTTGPIVTPLSSP